ncbi:probable splicing factor, arginine/serine-rich 4 [Acyrthosiphon pisum]|uniref:RRM domain-containing protein n=1 Tax=Acyrthosiphon pisum TaxID=7029 RepID=A0A8R2NNR0_ACYPI|nr:probable splicing factor, arginine/serine-rich 4 [Acyrthosiphon pisum]|eukprot:XP_008184614.2 PREDICTED: probable splicing factor, arginine/serine-rich 4 [Acyrthosiphon pisum]
MASSNSSNGNSNSKKFKFNSFLNLSSSKSSSNILQVKEMPTHLQLISNSTRKKWYDVTVKNAKSGSRTLKKPRPCIPIECKNKCPQTSCCIRITNLTRRVTVHCLRQIFSDFGTIKKLDLHFNHYDRISKGFSYIMFSTSEESENAVRNMNGCEIDGHEIICEQWFLPYTECRVSSILRGAYSGVGYQRGSSRCISPTYTTQRSSQLDRLSSRSGSLSNSVTPYDYLPTNKSFSGTSRRSYSRSPRQSRFRSCSNSSTIYHSKSQRKSRSRSRSNYHSIQDSMRSKSSRSRSSKRSRNIYSREPY